MSTSAGDDRGWLLPLATFAVAALIVGTGLYGVDVSAYLTAAYLCPLLIHAFLVLRSAQGENVVNQRRGAFALLAVAVAVILPCFPLLVTPYVRTWTLLLVGAVSIATSCVAIVARFGQMIDLPLFWQTILESVEVSAVMIALLWEWVFVRIDPHGVPRPLILLVVIVVGVLAAFVFQSGTREPEPGIRRLVLSALPILCCALVDLYTAVTGFPRWTANLLTTLAFTHLVWQIRRSTDFSAPLSAPGVAETRRVSAVASLTALLTIVAVASLAVDRQIEPVTWICIVLYILSVSARDVLATVRSRRLHDDLRWQALHDPLTGLPNRRSLEQWIEEQGSVPELSVITLDLDQFKDVNDLLGHSTGDALLTSVASALRDNLPQEGAEAFRMGGDEFTVVVSGSPEWAEETATGLMRAIDHAVTSVPGVGRLGVGASIGVQHLSPPRTVDGLRAALVEAGHAMRLAKTGGKHRIEIFDDSLHREQQRAKLIEVRLRERIDEVTVHFQPIWNIETEQIVGWEALARWTDAVCGEVQPTDFILVAEQVGLISDLGMSILDLALSQISANDTFRSEHSLHVNVSALQLRVPDFPDRVLGTLARHALTPDRLMLELAESTHFRVGGAEAAAMTRLAQAGVRLALDDFGAGSTSINNLTHLPVSMVKIDESLTRDMHQPSTAGIVHGMVSMCRGLQLAVVLEGVETVEQDRTARQLGLTLLQGRLLGGPVAIEHAPAVAARGRRSLSRLPSPRAQS